MSCFIFGDCLAVGLAAVMGGCASSAKVGISSTAVISRAPSAYYDLEIISTGSNDPKNPRLSNNLEIIRSKVRAGKIVWVRPVDMAGGHVVETIARKYGDGIAPVTPGRDHVHPKNYHVLASSILAQ